MMEWWSTIQTLNYVCMVQHHTDKKVCLHGGAPYKPRSMSVRCSTIRTQKVRLCDVAPHRLVPCVLHSSCLVIVSRQLNFLSGPWVECTIGYRARKRPRTCTYYLGKERSNGFWKKDNVMYGFDEAYSH